MGKPCEVVVVGMSFPENGMIHHEIERRLAKLPDVGACVALRKIEEPIAAANDGLSGELVGEADARRPSVIIRVDICRSGSLHFAPARNCCAGGRIEIHPLIVCFGEWRVDLIVKPDVQSQLIGHAPFVAHIEVPLIGVQRGRAGEEYVAANGDWIAEQHGGDGFAGPAGRSRIARICGIENPASKALSPGGLAVSPVVRNRRSTPNLIL